MASQPLHFEPNSLYIILLDLGAACLFEWQLYLASTSTTGRAFQITNDAGPLAWKYKGEVVYDMATSSKLVVALQLGIIGPTMHAALAARLALVPLTVYSVRYRESLCCRVWILEALFALDDEGYLDNKKGVREIEQEARQSAILNKSRQTRSVVRSSGFVS
ncbi:uncharacterized protein N7529_011368 [Penicillium soppii]|uniref:uncharacterized protein n=1 Tax=Penicillium soppii TaxID=69789 RepID=UPI0025493459|nr:uncharacterized protein N7529_011368 [Penicillium soppii]KAJ5851983.1 hypothetical protein N7529_011368 [Penicillium soppii]